MTINELKSHLEAMIASGKGDCAVVFNDAILGLKTPASVEFNERKDVLVVS